MKIAVTDEGEIARAFARFLGSNSNEIIIVDSPSKVIREKPDVILHTFEIPIFESNTNPPLAWSFNTWYAINIARAGSKVGSVNVFLSSFLIYDGKRGFYKEHNTPNPLNYYGLTKLVGESSIITLGNYLVLRVGALFSLSYRGFLFPFIKASTRGKILKCNKNFYMSIIDLNTLAKVSKLLIDKEARGVINVGSNRVSLFEICSYLSDIFGNEVIEIDNHQRDFSLDDWLLRAYNIKIDAKESILSLIEYRLLNN
ncbi:MAG: NAD(P)-dependent oxidoreductase [Saccharolobus sp.]|uniref:dTDP-4-dehydrorhamnose reductase n=1 Tax=Saccharolobus shibatae (strain ATCC 51178 / DSM 5389 / JCM 8931 / NBRC 15437 / B12) TaxID=523848 RepID=A0A8F5GSN8_SACSH|nr:NAD(P)-dependent oxidoreductase [Saccharolobus shibatae]MCH4815891.1 NAD(P)-dependent oxidoreductase [Saccharolobus shibatae]QXJ28093.1 dTDP-4-dehydrorhamnose reductase [Saccharolobus shibatae B12]